MYLHKLMHFFYSCETSNLQRKPLKFELAIFLYFLVNLCVHLWFETTRHHLASSLCSLATLTIVIVLSSFFVPIVSCCSVSSQTTFFLHSESILFGLCHTFLHLFLPYIPPLSSHQHESHTSVWQSSVFPLEYTLCVSAFSTYLLSPLHSIFMLLHS